MPPRVRELIAELEKAGFMNRGGKGESPKFLPPTGPQAGNDIG